MEANLDSQFEDAPGVLCRIIPSLDYVWARHLSAAIW